MVQLWTITPFATKLRWGPAHTTSYTSAWPSGFTEITVSNVGTKTDTATTAMKVGKTALPAMKRGVFCVGEDFQVLRPIVVPDAVLVMNSFAVRQRPTKHSFGNQDVFVDATSRVSRMLAL